ncbi:hypothetical protein HYX10_03940 [Candidatus Woesearchaeota archaeon]|nr:hypothetical protein [Candidatus Woesearchaeota archaeon]
MISNAGPLINFARINELDLLIRTVGHLTIGQKVFAEVTIHETQETALIKEQIESGNITVSKIGAQGLEEQIKKMFKELGKGETEAISLALNLKEKKVLLDDLRAREAARFSNLKPVGSLRVLLMAFEKNLVSEKKLKSIFTQMLQNKLWISGEVAMKFLELFEKMKQSYSKSR